MIALRIDVKNAPDAVSIDVKNAHNQVIDVYSMNANAIYKGEYEVTPRFAAQTLKTTDKLLTKNVTVGEIPYTETPNSDGGITVTIG